MTDHSKQIRAENRALHTRSMEHPEDGALDETHEQRTARLLARAPRMSPHANGGRHSHQCSLCARQFDAERGALIDDRPVAAPGSYNFYRAHAGGFVNKMLDAIALADNRNKERIRLAFPQLTAAFDLWYNNNERDGDCAPEGFAPDPFAVVE